MGEMEDKLSTILNNPEMMQQIMSMAQAFGAQQESPQPQPPQQPPDTGPQIDLGMIQKISGLARQSGIEPREQALLKALNAYLTADRVDRLEKAMRAAKMARIASSVLGQGGLQSLLGR